MHIMLFFTYGVSLQKWKETGLFEITNQFSRLVTERVIEAPYVEGAIEFIKSNYTSFDLFISPPLRQRMN